MFSSTLVEENLGLLRTEVLLRSFLTEFKIQASNVARRQAQLRNSASDPRSLLKGLIEDVLSPCSPDRSGGKSIANRSWESTDVDRSMTWVGPLK